MEAAMAFLLRLAVLLLGLVLSLPVQAQELLIFAAASLKTALDEINAGWTTRKGGVKASYAGSSALARQIEAGAPADIFFSADLDWMDYLQKRSLLKAGSRTSLLSNRIVLIAPADSKAQVTIAPGFALSELLGRDGRLAMADVNAVPAGKYGKAALESLDLWSSVQARIAQAENVRAALMLVSRGEAPAGIVYETDAATEKSVRILDRFPENTHPPIIYPAAVLAASQHPQAVAYLSHLRSAAARTVFEKHGFTLLAPQAAVN